MLPQREKIKQEKNKIKKTEHDEFQVNFNAFILNLSQSSMIITSNFVSSVYCHTGW